MLVSEIEPFFKTTNIQHFFKRYVGKPVEEIIDFILDDSKPLEVTRDQLFQLMIIQRELKNWKKVQSLCSKILKLEKNDLLFAVYFEESRLKLQNSRDHEMFDYLLKNFQNPKTGEQFFAIGKIYFFLEKLSEAFPFFEEAAKLNFPRYFEISLNSRASYILGVFYENGFKVSKNLKKAFEYYHRAADQFELSAYNNLGICFIEGIGVEKDFQLAFDWFRKGSEFGNPRSKYNLSLCYEKGIGVLKSIPDSLKYLKEAAKDGDILALFSLATMYFSFIEMKV